MTKTDIDLVRIKEAADSAAAMQGAAEVSDPSVQKMIRVVEAFLRAKKRICYGGSACNALLPPAARFYNPETDLPDYDFLSPTALEDGMELAEVFKLDLGFESVELRQGVHHGTYKLFVDFRGIADITEAQPRFFKALFRDAKEIDGIMYAHPNYLRMSMYLELSRPAGDVSRWGKVYQRLQLLNKYYPIDLPGDFCPKARTDFLAVPEPGNAAKRAKTIHNILIPHIASRGYVMLGAHTFLFYTNWHTEGKETIQELKKYAPAYIILSDSHVETAEEIATLLRAEFGNRVVHIKPHPRLNELIPSHYEVMVGNEHTVFVYQTVACHSYYPIDIGSRRTLRIASMDTILSLYLAFLLSERKYYEPTMLLCLAQYYVDRVAQLRKMGRPPLAPIALDCIGYQPTLMDIKKDYAARIAAARGTSKTAKRQPLAVYRPVTIAGPKRTTPKRPEDLFKGGKPSRKRSGLDASRKRSKKMNLT